ncbi:NAD(P)/FAD-dependent oxidoreductase [Leptolyngbya sp. O-77]|uniref:NAD(P)/FAD-dependent oxidoreductase n=1 Tax=Leptolyngbya sp. O-77 TaxID=1080068 RepID=UPI00074D2F7C|nr:FAD-dependent oxidoreductase [Leptolyngbya sp. O-77]BAU44990.1 NADH dehydrogenase-like protein [Leptolyngbya sp. O-77]
MSTISTDLTEAASKSGIEGDRPDTLPRVVIVGGGFAGIEAARALARSPVDVTVIDRTNHHLFQPLLYQVAAATLSPSDIASPIRQILRSQKNATVAMAEVTGVDPERQLVFMGDRPLPYDYLILATGAQQTYFGKDEWAAIAPGLKTVLDAVQIRDRVLRSFEQAELQGDAQQCSDILTFVLVGAGPTGVELAGTIAEMARLTLKSEFRRIDPACIRVILGAGRPHAFCLPSQNTSLPRRKKRWKTWV